MVLNRLLFFDGFYALIVIGLLSRLNRSLVSTLLVINALIASIPTQVQDIAKVIDPPIVAISDNITAVSAGEDIAVRYGAHAVISP